MGAFFRRWYGGSPLNLLIMLVGFCIGGYAASRIYVSSPVWLSIAVWFVCCILGHDIVLWPAYLIVDRLGSLLPRARASTPRTVPWLNHIRIPVGLSLLLLLVFFPLILKQAGGEYEGTTGLSLSVYLGHWLLVSAIFFAVSALWYGLRLLRARGDATSNRHSDQAELPAADRP